MPRTTTPHSPRLTHFLALTSSTLHHPITTTFPLTLSRFRDLATSPDYNIPPAAIRPLGTMHLTLGVMTLKNAEELERATTALRESVEASGRRKGGVRVRLVGLKTFDGRGGRCWRGRSGRGGRGRGRGGWVGRGDEAIAGTAAGEAGCAGEGEGEGEDPQGYENTKDPDSQASHTDYTNCRVLWVEPRDSPPATSSSSTTTGLTPEHGLDMVPSQESNASNLLTLANSLRDHFLSKGLIQLSPRDQSQPLTLHMTVFNAIYAHEGKRGGASRRTRNWEGYDVRGLVEEFKEVVWAEDVLFDRVEVMRMGEVKGEVGSAKEGESWYESVEAVML